VVEASLVTRHCEPVKGEFQCEDFSPDRDLTADILTEASRSGGDLVVLSVDRKKVENMQEEKRCVSYESVPAYQYVYNWATKSMDLVYGSRTECAEWANLRSKADLITSTGIVWRKDPGLAGEIRRAEELITAAGTGNLKRLAELVSDGVDLNRTTNAEGSLALSSAALMGQMDVVKFLISKGAKVNAFDRVASPLYQAAFGKNPEVAQFLLKSGAKADEKLPENEETALHAAARSGAVPVIKVLLDHGAKVDALNEDGITPLMVAAHEGNAGAVSLLIEKGADVHRKSTAVTSVIAHWTPLMFSVLSRDIETVLALLKGGADPQMRSYYGRRAVDNSAIYVAVGLTTLETHRLFKGATEGIWGYIDKLGKLVINAKYDKTWTFREGLGAVMLDKKWGYIDQSGKMVIEPKYSGEEYYGSRFYGGLAAVALSGKEAAEYLAASE